MPRPPRAASARSAAPLLPVSAMQVTPAAQAARTPSSAACRNCSGAVASFSARIVRIQVGKSRAALRPARWVSSTWVWVFTSPGVSAPSGNSKRVADAGAGTRASGPTAAIVPRSSTRTAPSAIGGAVTGCTVRARMRSTPPPYGDTPMPNGVWTGHAWVGSVPG